MIQARKIRNACPRCKAHLLGLADSGFVHAQSRSPALRTSPVPARPPLGTRPKREFSSSRPVFLQETPNPPNISDDIAGSFNAVETLVRQARQTFGSTLPPDYLTAEEYRLYERLYGPPLRETRPEDVGISRQNDGDTSAGRGRRPNKSILLRETELGTLEEVEYTIESMLPAQVARNGTDETAVENPAPLSKHQLDYLNVTANNQREYEALVKLQREFEARNVRAAEEDDVDESVPEDENIDERVPEDENIDENEEPEDDPGAVFEEVEEPSRQRLHAHTVMGHFGTYPSTLHLPKQEFVEPITALLKRTDTVHVQQAAEKAFGGQGLPYSPATPEAKKQLPMKPVAMQAGHHKMSEIEADAYLAAVLPGVYASSMSALVEVRKRLGTDWIRGMLQKGDDYGPRVLDVGAGGAALAAWQEILEAEWELLRERGEVSSSEPPPGKRTVVVGSNHLRHRVSRFLHNTTFLPRLPDYVHSTQKPEDLDLGDTAQARKMYDVIIATHVVLPLDKQYKREALLDNLWSMLSPEGGVLIVLEKGHPRGFEAVADVRARLLNDFIVPPTPQPAPEIQVAGERVREPGMIVAPCTNHAKCPMYLTPGLSQGRKDFCHFSQRFIRPPFLQRILGAAHRNHEDVKFSFVAVRRGAHVSAPLPLSTFFQGPEATDRAFTGYETTNPVSAPTANPTTMSAEPHPLNLPRSIRPPLKRRGHVTMDLCTPAGGLERWTVPRSFSRQAYHDARKMQWGDLWALGAKTRIRTNVRLGRGLQDEQQQQRQGDAQEQESNQERHPQGAGKAGAKSMGVDSTSRRKQRPRVVDITVDASRGTVDARERFPGGRGPAERRAGKGGRKAQVKDLLAEMGVDDESLLEPDDEEEKEMLRELGNDVPFRTR